MSQQCGTHVLTAQRHDAAGGGAASCDGAARTSDMLRARGIGLLSLHGSLLLPLLRRHDRDR